jgi:hypothetical protein
MQNAAWKLIRVTAATLLVWSSAAGSSRAAPGTVPPRDEIEQPGAAALAARNGMALANTLPATIDPEQRAMAIALGGYDSSASTGIARFVGDVHLIGPLDLRVGLSYLSDVDVGQHQFEPQVGLRLRILRQEQSGIDLATAVFYRRDRYASDEGMIQLNVAIGRRWDRLGILGNLAYGQDPEGDDRDGDVALAVLYELIAPLQVGVESHLRFDLASDDPRRSVRHQGPLDFQAGPFAHYAFGPALLIVEAGVSAYRFENTRAGVYALGGVGGVY